MPEVRDAGVVVDARHLGVATAMIAALAAAVREHGLSRIGFSVALAAEDEPARDLYAKLGYAVAHGPFISSTNCTTTTERRSTSEPSCRI